MCEVQKLVSAADYQIAITRPTCITPVRSEREGGSKVLRRLLYDWGTIQNFLDAKAHHRQHGEPAVLDFSRGHVGPLLAQAQLRRNEHTPLPVARDKVGGMKLKKQTQYAHVRRDVVARGKRWEREEWARVRESESESEESAPNSSLRLAPDQSPGPRRGSLMG